MSLIAGVSGGWVPSFDPAFREHLRTFPIIRGENPDDYDLDFVGYGASGYDNLQTKNGGVTQTKKTGDAQSQEADKPQTRDQAGLIVGTRLKKTSMDTIMCIPAGGMYVFCLGFNEFLRDTAGSLNSQDSPDSRVTADSPTSRDSAASPNSPTSPELVDMPEDELLTRIKEADGEFVAVAVPNPARAIAALKKKSSTGKSGDTASGALHIFTDRFASRPCFFSLSDGQFRFSTNIAFLLEIIPGGVTLDRLSLMQLLSIGHTLSGRTTFREVERMRPAEHLIIQNGRITGRSTYYKPAEPDSPISDYGVYAGDTYDEMVASVEKRSRGRKGFVSLSGGLDSRMVAAAADRDRFTAFTFINSTKSKDTPEVRAARGVARKLDMEHIVLPLGETALISDVIDDVLRLTGGQTAVHHPVKTMSFIRHMQRHGFHMGGGSGGVLAGSEVSSGSVRKSDDMVAGYIAKRLGYTDAFLGHIFRLDEQADLPGKLRDAMRASFEAIDTPDPARKITIWAVNEGQAAFTFLSPVHNHPDVAESMPLLGYSYTERMLNLSGRELVNKNFYQFMIYHCLEELRQVPYSNSGRRLDSELITRHYPLERLSHYSGMLAKVRRKLGKRLRRGRRAKPHFHYEMMHGDRKALDRTIELLQENAALRQLFHTGNCLEFISRFRDGHITFSPETDANVVSFLVTVAHIAAMFPVTAE